MRPNLENILMSQLSLSYGDARKLVLQGRESLGMSKFSDWTDDLEAECVRLYEASGGTVKVAPKPKKEEPVKAASPKKVEPSSPPAVPVAATPTPTPAPTPAPKPATPPPQPEPKEEQLPEEEPEPEPVAVPEPEKVEEEPPEEPEEEPAAQQQEAAAEEEEEEAAAEEPKEEVAAVAEPEGETPTKADHSDSSDDE